MLAAQHLHFSVGKAEKRLQQTLLAPGLPLPDLPPVLQPAFLPGPHLQELLPSTHLDIPQVHPLLPGHAAGATGNVLGELRNVTPPQEGHSPTALAAGNGLLGWKDLLELLLQVPSPVSPGNGVA